MSLSKDNNEQSDVWQDKYYRLLESQERLENDYKSTEELLCKTIVRFALAVKGFDKTLDPHFERIRNALKTGLQSEQLRAELESFSDTLARMEDKTAAPLDSTLLFGFFDQYCSGKQTELADLRSRYHQGELNEAPALFLELANLIETQPSITSVSLSAEDSGNIKQLLTRLLESIDVPAQFAGNAQQLMTRLQAEQAIIPIFEDAVNLLLSIKKHMQTEQHKMAEFLAKLTEELAELGMKAVGVNDATETFMQNRSNLDRDVEAQMQELQQSSSTATQLEPLKQLVNIRLQKIAEQIQSHNQQEQVEREKHQQALTALVQQIKHLEAESQSLQIKLEQAEKQATRDPLTQLPNRLAFELRLADEIARFRRRGTPLSIAIWDVDLFKEINDNYGHKAGDKALSIIGKLLTNQCRESDFVCRYGGEEFVMLLPEANGKAALKLSDKLRTIVEHSSFNANGNRITITLSCGITEYEDDDTAESLFERADGALYQAKQNGRNQCVLQELANE